jgi:hypothetical protein
MKNIFDTIKERLLGHESDLDLDREWAALHQRRAQKHQRGSHRRLATVLLLLLFVGSCGSLIWLNMRNTAPANPAPAQRDDMAQQPAVPSATNPGSPSNAAPNTPNTPATNVDNRVRANNVPTTKGANNGTSAPVNVENNTVITAPEYTNPVKTPFNNANTATPTANPPAVISPMAVKLPETAPQSPETTPETPTNQWNNVPVANDGTTTSAMANAAPESTATSVSYTRTNDNISLLPGRGIAVPVMAEVVAPALPAPYLPTPQEPTAAIVKKHVPAKNFSVFVGGGWLGAQQRFRVAAGESESYAALRQNTETALPSFTFNAGVQRTLGKKGFVEASLHYNQWYQRLNYTFEQPKNYSYSNILLKVTRIDGFGSEVLPTYGDTVIAGKQTVQIVHYNQFTSINLRLALGRQLVQTRRLAISAGAGIDGSVWRSAQGMVAAQDPVVGTLDLNEIYKNSFGLGISAVARFEYWLYPKYALHLAPGAVWWLGNALHTNGQLEARWQQVSVSAGVTHRF